jgi:hypothetical protein
MPLIEYQPPRLLWPGRSAFLISYCCPFSLPNNLDFDFPGANVFKSTFNLKVKVSLVYGHAREGHKKPKNIV